MPIFAQMPDALHYGGWMLCAAAAVSFFNSVAKLIDRIKGHPPAEQLELTGQVLEKRVDAVETKIEGVARDQDERRRAIYAELGKVRESIQEVSNHVSGLQTASDITNQRLVLLDGKVDRLIERKH